MKRAFVYFCAVLLSLEVIVLSIKNQQIMRTIKNIANDLSTGSAINNINLYSGLKEISEWKTAKKTSFIKYLGNRNAVVFYLSTTCSSCDEAVIYWNIIYAKYGDEFDIFGLSRDNEEAIGQYLVRNRVQFPIFKIIKLDEGIDLLMSRTPMTIIINRDGSISGTHEGIIREFDEMLSNNKKEGLR